MIVYSFSFVKTKSPYMVLSLEKLNNLVSHVLFRQPCVVTKIDLAFKT